MTDDQYAQLVVTRTLQVTYTVPVSAYLGMVAEEAAQFERNTSAADAREIISVVAEDHPGPVLSCTVAIERGPKRLLTQAVELIGPRPDEKEAVMLRVGGNPYRCECGANVFTRAGTVYTCNGCQRQYEGTPGTLVTIKTGSKAHVDHANTGPA